MCLFLKPKVLSLQVVGGGATTPVYACATCGKRMSSLNGYKCHMNLHKGIHKYNCTECGKGFASITRYKEHMSTHTNLPHFQCTNCGETFMKYQKLKEHRHLCAKTSMPAIIAIAGEVEANSVQHLI